VNPRLFCRERGFHKALLLTYSFDPIFFEQVVLPDLWAGRSSDILVLGDKNQIDMSIQSAAGQLWHLGRRYLLAGAKVPGAFHPKVFLRLGPKDGVVMLGSGNVTSSGWGGNQELGTAWMIGPDHPDKGGWLHPFLDEVLAWCHGDLERDAVRRIKDVPWLSLTAAESIDASPMLHSRQSNSLASELARRWAGRRFDEVKVLTGSTDQSGAFLRWANATFGVTRATVALTPSSASFIPERLEDLPLELRLVAAPPERPLHAKLYWFEGADGPAAAMGSANCSAAAWLVAPESGGNIEAVVVYDQPDAEGFESALKLFAAPGQTPAEILTPRSTHDAEPPGQHQPFVLKSLQWDNLSRHLHAAVVPAPDPSAIVELLLGGRRVPMSGSSDSAGHWTCALIEGLDAATVFASVIVTIGDDTWVIGPRWVDDVASLEHASQAARLLEPFKGLERHGSSAEQRQMLDELQEVALALFSDSSSFRDPNFGRTDRKTKDDAPLTPVNPNDLIVHLEESNEALPPLGSARPGSLSLTGILRLLFEAEADDGSPPAAAEDEDIDEGQIPDGPVKPKRATKTEHPGEGSYGPPVEARFRERLASQINTFLTEMSATAFSERCTATQMVQAVSFPLAVALRGRRRGWVKAELAERWALEIFSILFRSRGAGSGGLLSVVERRYAQNGKKDTFDGVVGDGTLWLVLVATLGGANWHGVGTEIDKAVALAEVFAAPQLLASAQPARITGLLGKIRIEDAKSYVTHVAPTVIRLLWEIEGTLLPVWESEMRGQSERGITHELGDLLWREKVGWAVCLAETQAHPGQSIKVRLRGVEKDVMTGYYVNVSEACRRHPDLAHLIEELRQAVADRSTFDASEK
jgi:hypothetical protein